MKLAIQYCIRHGDRHAAAKCLSCGRHYCRECVTEHAGRYTCTDCLKEQQPVQREGLRGWHREFLKWASCFIVVYLVWYLFYRIALLLLQIPDSMHAAHSLKDAL